MTRRLLIALLGLVAVLLIAVVLPLGLETARHYRQDYADSTLAQARALATVAEERLSDHAEDATLVQDLARYVSAGDGVVLRGNAGQTLDRAGRTFTIPAGLRESTGARTLTTTHDDGSLTIAAVPITGDSGLVGTVVLARPNAPLSSRIDVLWLTLGTASTGAALLAVSLAYALSRWVTAPVRRLEHAAHSVGAGDLTARAAVGAGPVEVRRLAATFDTMAARLATLLERHRAVIADVSHQLRTPMSALRLRLELLSELQPENDEELRGALDEVNRLSRLIDGLLAVARAEGTDTPPIVVDVQQLVAERVGVWGPLAAERGVDLVLGPNHSVYAWAVPGHLEQVLDNLFANCFDLEPPPTHVSVDVRPPRTDDADQVAIVVADDGPGIPAFQRESAFQRFTTSNADGGGTGLGLAIVHRMITAMGGHVRLEDSAGGGLAVTFTLPVADPHSL